MQLTDSLRAEYQHLWDTIAIPEAKKPALAAICQKLAANKARYEAVSAQTGVPWYFIACVHERESSCNFATALHNGDPLHDHDGKPLKTVHVPAGRGPFADWEASAVDSIKYQGLDKVTDWSLTGILYQLERYNGFGYRSARANIHSPYLWSWTSAYRRGKFSSDGHYDAALIDPQPGCVAMLLQLILLNLIPTLAEKVIPMAIDAVNTAVNPSASSVATPVSVPSAGVTINKNQNLATHLIVLIGGIIGALGLSQAHTVYDAVTSSGAIGGLAVAGLALAISHWNVNGSNDNTIDLVDKIVVALTPPAQNVSLLQQSGATPAAPTSAA